ncbi:hypothetical protein [Paenibacillus peoriae]|nr:hypothetical protein [Paenibacillus peoriae]
MKIKTKTVLTLLVSSFMLLSLVIAPLQSLDKGTIFQPTGNHGGM